MAYASGQGESLYMGLEASYKTLPGTVVADKVTIQNPAVAANVSEFTSQALTGSISPRPPVYGKVSVGGQVDVECNVDTLQTFLRFLTGANATVAGVATCYDHPYPFVATSESWFIEQRHTDIGQYLQWYGCYGNGASFNFQSEGLMTATCNVVGAKQAVTQATVINSTITDRTASSPIEYMAATVTQGSSSLAALAQSVSLTPNRNLQPINTMSGDNALAGYAGNVATIDGTLTTLFQDNTLLDLATNGTETSLSLLCPAPVSGLGLKVIMPSVKIKPTSPRAAGAGLTTLQFAFKAYARGSASNIPGQAQSKYLGTGTVSLGGNTSLKVKLDGAGAITATVADGTPTAIAATINSAITSTGSAAVENGRIVIKSKGTGGSTSSVQIDNTGTAQTPLGFDTVAHNGFDACPLLFVLTNTNAT